MTSSAPQLPDTVDRDYATRQAARLLLEAETDMRDSRERDLIVGIADSWIALADVLDG